MGSSHKRVNHIDPFNKRVDQIYQFNKRFNLQVNGVDKFMKLYVFFIQ